MLITKSHLSQMYNYSDLLSLIQIWSSILQHSPAEQVALAISPLFQSMAWLWLLVAPSHSPIEANLLVPPSPGSTVKKVSRGVVNLFCEVVEIGVNDTSNCENYVFHYFTPLSVKQSLKVVCERSC